MKVIEIKNIETGEIVKTIDVTNESPHNIEKCLMGIIRNMNQEKFIAYETEREQIKWVNTH